MAVSGRLVLEGRKILTIDEAGVLERVQTVYDAFVERAGLGSLRENPQGFWGVSGS